MSYFLTYDRVMQSDPSSTRFLNIANCSLNPGPTGHMVSNIGYTQFKRTVFRSMLLEIISLQVSDVKTTRPLHALEGYGCIDTLALSQDGSCTKTNRRTVALSS
jgi:hypothetical protein